MRQPRDYKEEDDSNDFNEDPADSEMDNESDDETDHQIPCPHCRHMIYDDAERCSHCGEYISEEDAPRTKPSWFLLTVIVCVLVVVIFWVFFGQIPGLP